MRVCVYATHVCIFIIENGAAKDSVVNEHYTTLII